MIFEEEYPIKGKLIMSTITKDGMLFQIEPLVSLDMDSEQIKGELKVARIKLNEKVNEWDNSKLDKQKVKEAIKKHFVYRYCGDGTVHSSNCRMCLLLKELRLE